MLKITCINQMPSIQDKGGWPYYHGDCTLIQLPDGRTILIDISTAYNWQYLTEQLLAMGIKKIDIFVISHLHQDHTAGFAYLNERIPVGEIYYAGYGCHNADVDPTALCVAEEQAIPLKVLRQGDQVQLGDVSLDVLWPKADAPDPTVDDTDLDRGQQGAYLNLYSLVFRLQYMMFSALFTGDIHEESELDLITQYGDKLCSTLLKVPHHGNRTSTSNALVEAVRPSFGLCMSTGCEWVIQRRFANRGIPLYGTWCDGTIQVETDGQTVTVCCDKGERLFTCE